MFRGCAKQELLPQPGPIHLCILRRICVVVEHGSLLAQPVHILPHRPACHLGPAFTLFLVQQPYARAALSLGPSGPVSYPRFPSSLHTQLNTLIIRVQQEGSETAGRMVITKELEVELTELKLHGELQMDLYEVGGQGSG